MYGEGKVDADGGEDEEGEEEDVVIRTLLVGLLFPLDLGVPGRRRREESEGEEEGDLGEEPDRAAGRSRSSVGRNVAMTSVKG